MLAGTGDIDTSPSQVRQCGFALYRGNDVGIGGPLRHVCSSTVSVVPMPIFKLVGVNGERLSCFGLRFDAFLIGLRDAVFDVGFDTAVFIGKAGDDFIAR